MCLLLWRRVMIIRTLNYMWLSSDKTSMNTSRFMPEVMHRLLGTAAGAEGFLCCNLYRWISELCCVVDGKDLEGYSSGLLWCTRRDWGNPRLTDFRPGPEIRLRNGNHYTQSRVRAMAAIQGRRVVWCRPSLAASTEWRHVLSTPVIVPTFTWYRPVKLHGFMVKKWTWLYSPLICVCFVVPAYWTQSCAKL
jgi:hypothetical protein